MLPQAQVDNDTDAMRQTALDYLEGWYEGDAVRMERALHPELAKRIVHQSASPKRQDELGQMSAMTLVQLTRHRAGIASDSVQQRDVIILDRFANAASVKVIATQWIDYLHMVKWQGRWVILNVLWELKPVTA